VRVTERLRVRSVFTVQKPENTIWKVSSPA